MDDEIIELAFDTVVHQTDAAKLIDFGDQEVWVPNSVIGELDEGDHVITLYEWFATKEGLI